MALSKSTFHASTNPQKGTGKKRPLYISQKKQNKWSGSNLNVMSKILQRQQ